MGACSSYFLRGVGSHIGKTDCILTMPIYFITSSGIRTIAILFSCHFRAIPQSRLHMYFNAASKSDQQNQSQKEWLHSKIEKLNKLPACDTSRKKKLEHQAHRANVVVDSIY